MAPFDKRPDLDEPTRALTLASANRYRERVDFACARQPATVVDARTTVAICQAPMFQDVRRADDLRRTWGYTGVALNPQRGTALPSPVVPPKIRAGAKRPGNQHRRAQRCRRAAGAAAGPRRGCAERRRGGHRHDRPRRRPGRSLCERCSRSRCRVDVVGSARAQRAAAGQLLAQGVHPRHPPVPRHLPLLHLRRHPRQAARPGSRHVHGARRDPRRRSPWCRIRL